MPKSKSSAARARAKSKSRATQPCSTCEFTTKQYSVVSAANRELAEWAERLKRHRNDDELMLAKQRERLIRLTEIKNWATSMVALMETMWQSRGNVSIELGGTVWIKEHNILAVCSAGIHLGQLLSALEVDGFLPGKSK